MESNIQSKETEKKSRKGIGGAPYKQIDWDKVDQMLVSGGNGVQIAATLGIHPETLYNRCESEKKSSFSAYAQEKRSIGDRMIHSAQFELGVKNKNATMLIWLGKQRCGQKDMQDQVFDQKTEGKFDELIEAIEKHQLLSSSEPNIAESNSISETKSE